MDLSSHLVRTSTLCSRSLVLSVVEPRIRPNYHYYIICLIIIHVQSLSPFALLIGSVFFFRYLNGAHCFVSFCLILYNLGCILFVDFLFFSQFFLTSIAIYLCHSHYNVNIHRVGYRTAIQTVMHIEWLACFWCILNQDQVLGYQDMITF